MDCAFGVMLKKCLTNMISQKFPLFSFRSLTVLGFILKIYDPFCFNFYYLVQGMD